MVGNENVHREALLKAYPLADDAGCNGDGKWGWAVKDGEEGQVRCPECAREKVLAAIGAFIPPRFRDPVDIPEPVGEWASRGHRAQGLYLAGQVGTGKTHAAWMALARWCEVTNTVPTAGGYESAYGVRSGPSVVFTRMTDLLDDLRPGADSTLRVRDCQNAKLLVIDDLGAEKPSEWTQERLYSVVDHRYANCLPLIVTSNLPPLKLVEQTGGRTESRLAEMCVVVPMTGPDRRKPAA